RIVNIASAAGAMGNAGQANYSAAKAGLIGLTKASARELAHWGILVNAVAPGLIETDMTAAIPDAARQAFLAQVPVGRIGTAREVAEVVGFLAGDGASYITGQVFHVNGGLYMRATASPSPSRRGTRCVGPPVEAREGREAQSPHVGGALDSQGVQQ